jgi:hypothetical protein
MPLFGLPGERLIGVYLCKSDKYSATFRCRSRKHAGGPVFGYPSEPRHTGRSLDYYQGTLQPDPFGTQDEGIACAMTEGGSGGPWLSDFDPRAGLGVITGVTTFRYSGQDRILYSAGLGPVAQALYKRASSLSSLSLWQRLLGQG